MLSYRDKVNKKQLLVLGRLWSGEVFNVLINNMLNAKVNLWHLFALCDC